MTTFDATGSQYAVEIRAAGGALTIGFSAALVRVAEERARQIAEEGFTPEHDDGHARGELARAGAAYAAIAGQPDAQLRGLFPAGSPPNNWPWARQWWKPRDPRRDLVRAAALIVAEIERLDRADAANAATASARSFQPPITLADALAQERRAPYPLAALADLLGRPVTYDEPVHLVFDELIAQPTEGRIAWARTLWNGATRHLGTFGIVVAGEPA